MPDVPEETAGGTADRCPQCFNAGWVLDAKIDREPTQLELIPCIYPPCRWSGRAVAILSLYGRMGAHATYHPITGDIMSVSRG